MEAIKKVFSTNETAKHFNVESWRVRRVFEQKLVPDPPRLVGNRIVTEDMLPLIEQALIEKGWLPHKDAIAVDAR